MGSCSTREVTTCFGEGSRLADYILFGECGVQVVVDDVGDGFVIETENNDERLGLHC